MSRYKVTVNGKTFEVIVEEVDGGQITAPQAPKAAPASAVSPSVTEAKGAVKEDLRVEAGDMQVTAPLSGVILSLKVQPGEKVTKGQLLLTLEALKMENEILAPEAGEIKSLLVQGGATVNAGDLLLVIRPQEV